MASENYQINVEVVNKASATLTEISNQLKGIGTSGQQGFNMLGGQLQSLAAKADIFSNAIQGVAAALAAREVLNYVSDIQTLDNRLRLVTNSQAELNSTYDKLFEIAQNTRQALAPTVDLYAKLKLSQDQIGLSTGDLMKVVESFNKTLMISGTSTQGAASALYQFAQAMQSGRLQGDELRTMLEVNPMLMKVLTEQTGFTTAELRKLASEGFLNAKIVGLALRDGLEDLNEQMGKMPITVGQALQALSNSFQATIRDFLNMSGSGNILVGVIQAVEYAIKPLTVALLALGGALAIAATIKALVFIWEAYTVAVTAARVATGLFNTVFAATPWGRVATLVGVVATAVMAFGSSSKDTEKEASKLGDTTDNLGKQSKTAAKGSQELKDELEKSGAMAKVSETAFSKYTDQLKEQIKYSGLFSKERRDMVEVERVIQETINNGRKIGKQYTDEEIANMRARAQALLNERDERLRITDELESRYKGYLQFIKTNQDKSLTDQQKYEKDFAQATLDRQNISKFSEEEYQKYIAALRADYSKKYVDLIQKERLANMTTNQKYAADLAQLEADRDAGRLSQDLNYEEAKYAIQKKYAEDYFRMAENARTQDMSAYGKYQEELMKFKNNSAAQEVLTEEQKHAIMRKLNKDYVDATASEYSNLYGFLNNKLLEMTGISREKWGIMTDIVKIFGIDTNQLLKEAFAMAIGWVKNFVGLGSEQMSLFSSNGQWSIYDLASYGTSTFITFGEYVADVSMWAADKMVNWFNQGWSLLAEGASWTGDLLWDVLGNVFDWAFDNLGSIASSVSGWFGGGGGGGGFLDTVIDIGTALFSIFAKGGVFNNGAVTKFAKGAIISHPSIFPMAHNGIGMMGEAGPEAIVPLSRTGNGDLGISMEGMGWLGDIVSEVTGLFSGTGSGSLDGWMGSLFDSVFNVTTGLLDTMDVQDTSTSTAFASSLDPIPVYVTNPQAVNVNFTINAVDSQSVEDMLVNNSTTISNIIRQAVNDQGADEFLGSSLLKLGF